MKTTKRAGVTLLALLASSAAWAVDTDGDGIFDEFDNCPVTANSDQLDSDFDAMGNACDSDDDDDGVNDGTDACPLEGPFTRDTTPADGCQDVITLTKPDSIYIDHGNGTVTDHETNLMWMQCSQGLSGAGCAIGAATAMNWKQSLEAAQTANAGVGTFGYTDWRLPTTAELGTLIDQAIFNPAINTTLFPATVSSSYWSSSPYAASSSSAWVVNFNNGYEHNGTKHSNVYVRLVRGGL